MRTAEFDFVAARNFDTSMILLVGLNLHALEYGSKGNHVGGIMTNANTSLSKALKIRAGVSSWKRAFFLVVLVVSTAPFCVLAETLYEAAYEYDQRGFVTNLIETYNNELAEHRNFSYDALGRIVQEDIGTHQTQYQYDHLGNRILQTHPSEQQTYHYNSRNELLRQDLSVGTRYLYYDLNGSLTQKVTGAVTMQYTWDSRGRLRQVSTNGVNVFRADYAEGLNRQRKTEGSTTKVFRHDGATAIQEVNDSGKVKELIRGDRGASTVGGILYSGDEEGTNTYTYNGVGSTIVLSKEDGTARSVKYDAFGNIIEADEGVDTERLANTKELDQSIGLYFHGARYYDATTGRYISRDPARDGINHYIYANNAPLSFVDPTGLESCVSPSYWSGRCDTSSYEEKMALNLALTEAVVGSFNIPASYALAIRDANELRANGYYWFAGFVLATAWTPGDDWFRFFRSGSRSARRGGRLSIDDGMPPAGGSGGGTQTAPPAPATGHLEDAPPEKIEIFLEQAMNNSSRLPTTPTLWDGVVGLLDAVKGLPPEHALQIVRAHWLQNIHPFARYASNQMLYEIIPTSLSMSRGGTEFLITDVSGKMATALAKKKPNSAVSSIAVQRTSRQGPFLDTQPLEGSPFIAALGVDDSLALYTTQRGGHPSMFPEVLRHNRFPFLAGEFKEGNIFLQTGTFSTQMNADAVDVSSHLMKALFEDIQIIPFQ